DAFEANDIGMDLVKQVNDQMLKDIGVLSAGHRLRIRNAIAKSAPASVSEANISSATPSTGPPAFAEASSGARWPSSIRQYLFAERRSVCRFCRNLRYPH